MAMNYIETPYPKFIAQIAATNPERAYACIPKTQDILDGYRDFTYPELCRAVDRMSFWLDEQLGKAKDGELPTFSYLGVNDLRYVFVYLAAMNTRRKVLVLGMTSRAGQINLLKATDCQVLLASKEKVEAWEALRPEIETKIVVLPEWEYFVDGKDTETYPYDFSWEDVKDDQCMIVHTSGTTGLPKPIYYSQYMLSLFLGPHNKSSVFLLTKGLRTIVPVPISWAMTAVVYTTAAFAYNMIPVLLPSSVPLPPSAAVTHALHKVLDPPAEAAVYIPFMIKELAANEEYFELMKKTFKTLWFAGAPLDLETGNKLAPHMIVQSAMGSTELGGYGLEILPEHLRATDWMYYKFPQTNGWSFEHYHDNLYHAVMVKHKDPEEAKRQMAFFTFPDLDRYETRDLWIQHSEDPHMWKYAGRMDDFLKLVTLTKWNALSVEEDILAGLRGIANAVIMGGDARDKPFLIVETISPTTKLEDILPVIEKVNEPLAKEIRIRPEMILLVQNGTLPRVAHKGTVIRRAAMDGLAKEIDQLYAGGK